MSNEFYDYKLSIEEQQAMLERDQPENNEKNTDEKIIEMQDKMKIMDDSLTEIILDNLS